MLNVLVSGLFIHPGKVGGAEHYFYNLVRGFQARKEEVTLTLLLNESYRPAYDKVIENSEVVWVVMKRNRAISDYFLHYRLGGLGKYHIILQPNYITPLHLRGRKKYITTIHDLQYLHFPSFFSPLKRKWQYYSHKYTLRAADKVICISDFVKKDIIEKFGARYTDKLVTIHNPIDYHRFGDYEAMKRPYSFEYLLSVSALYPHKNTLTLVRAFISYKEKKDSEKNLKLVLTGAFPDDLIGFSQDDYQSALLTVVKGRDDIIMTGHVSNEALGALYHHCKLFAFPSLFEGFGMPPIEAMGFAKPVITTRCGSIQEVTLDEAIYVDEPKDANEWAEKIDATLKDIAKYSARFEKVKAKVRQHYSIENIASAYIAAFNSK